MMKQFVFLAVLGVLVEFSYAEREKSECERHRDRESASNAPLPLRMVPECDEYGDYQPKQCSEDGKFCACWDRWGNQVTQPSEKVKSCKCLIESAVLSDEDKPACEEDGKYKQVQCEGSEGYCWCVDPETGERLTDKGWKEPQCDDGMVPLQVNWNRPGRG